MGKVRLWRRDYDVIEGLRHGFYTTTQLARLYFSSKKKAAERLKLLFCAGFVGRFQRPLLDVRGKPEFVYCQKSRKNPKSYLWINHALAISDFHVWLACGARAVEELKLFFLMGKEIPKQVHKGLIIPDALFVLQRGDKRLLYFLEADLGNESLSSCGAGYGFGDKLDFYADYFDGGGYNSDVDFWSYSFKGFRLVVVFDSEARLKNFLKIAGEKCADFVLCTTTQQLSKSGLLDKIWRTTNDEGLADITGK